MLSPESIVVDESCYHAALGNELAISYPDIDPRVALGSVESTRATLYNGELRFGDLYPELARSLLVSAGLQWSAFPAADGGSMSVLEDQLRFGTSVTVLLDPIYLPYYHKHPGMHGCHVVLLSGVTSGAHGVTVIDGTATERYVGVVPWRNIRNAMLEVGWGQTWYKLDKRTSASGSGQEELLPELNALSGGELATHLLAQLDTLLIRTAAAGNGDQGLNEAGNAFMTSVLLRGLRTYAHSLRWSAIRHNVGAVQSAHSPRPDYGALTGNLSLAWNCVVAEFVRCWLMRDPAHVHPKVVSTLNLILDLDYKRTARHDVDRWAAHYYE